MKTLREHMDEVDDETRALKQIKPDIPGRIGENVVVITAILERTAVVHPPGQVDGKFLVRLDAIKVLQAHVEWVDKPLIDRQRHLAGVQGRRNATAVIARGNSENLTA